MLSLEQKLAVVESFPELQRKNVSLGRINYHYEDSVYEKKIVVYHLHPNGNGFVYADYVPGYETDDKGFVNIREFDEEELRKLIGLTIRSLSSNKNERAGTDSDAEGSEECWADESGNQLTVTFVEDLWYVYAGSNLDSAFETYEEVEEYMSEEGFARR